MRMLVFACLLTLAGHAAAQPMPDESDPLIAAVVVYSTSYSIERWETYCSDQYPASASAIAAARSSWMDSHSELIGKAATIFRSKYSKDERMQVAVQARLANDELESRLGAAPESARVQWCEESPQRIQAPEMDLRRRSTLVSALQGIDP